MSSILDLNGNFICQRTLSHLSIKNKLKSFSFTKVYEKLAYVLNHWGKLLIFFIFFFSS